jgi:hypothetical protein
VEPGRCRSSSGPERLPGTFRHSAGRVGIPHSGVDRVPAFPSRGETGRRSQPEPSVQPVANRSARSEGAPQAILGLLPGAEGIETEEGGT